MINHWHQLWIREWTWVVTSRQGSINSFSWMSWMKWSQQSEWVDEENLNELVDKTWVVLATQNELIQPCSEKQTTLPYGQMYNSDVSVIRRFRRISFWHMYQKNRTLNLRNYKDMRCSSKDIRFWGKIWAFDFTIWLDCYKNWSYSILFWNWEKVNVWPHYLLPSYRIRRPC